MALSDDSFSLESDFSEDFKVETLIKCVLISLIGVVCIVGNLLVIRTLIFFKYPKIHIYVMIGGLAVADLLKITLEIPPVVIRWTHKGDVITSEWCQFIFYLVQTCTYVAACHLVALSIIRCIMLTDRAHYSKSYVIHAFVSSLVMWGLIMLANIPNASSIIKDNFYGCVQSGDLNEDTERNNWLRIAFSYLLPLTVIAVVYIVTWYLTQRFFADSYSHREQRLSRMVTFLIVSFLICKLPFEIVSLMLFYQGRIVLDSFQNMPVNESNIHLELDKILSQTTSEKASDTFDLWHNISEFCEIVALLDLALRPIFYAKLSYYFSKSFDEVINCTSCRENKPQRPSSHYRNGNAVRLCSQNVPSLTPLTIEHEESPDNRIEIVDTIYTQNEDNAT